MDKYVGIFVHKDSFEKYAKTHSKGKVINAFVLVQLPANLSGQMT